MKRRNKLAGTESEINAMNRELSDLHHDVGLLAMREHTRSWSDELRSRGDRPTSRRSFLFGAGGAVAGGLVLATAGSIPGMLAAGAASSGSRSDTKPNSAGGTGGLSGDLAVVGLAASLENLAVAAYTAGIQAAQAGKLGTVPPAISNFAVTARSQHMDHADAWNGILKASGKHAVTVTDPGLTPAVDKALTSVSNVTELGQLALSLELGAAETYQVQAAKLESPQGISTAASIQPVEMQHAAILYYVLGKYPGIQTKSGTPLAFSPTTMAVSR